MESDQELDARWEVVVVGFACDAACDAADAEALRAASRQLWAAAGRIKRRDPAAHDALVALGYAAWWLAGGQVDQAEDALDRAARSVPAERAIYKWVDLARDALAWRVKFFRRTRLLAADEPETK